MKTIKKKTKKRTIAISEEDMKLARDSLRRLEKNPIFLCTVDRLKPNSSNPNVMQADAYAQLRANIETYGFLQPVLVNAALDVLDGHHRLEVAKELGMDAVPCVLYEGPDSTAPLVGLSMNKIRGEIDMSEVAKIFDSLVEKLTDEELTTSGYTSEEIDAMLEAAKASTMDEDAALEGATRGSAETPEEEVDRPAILELTFTSTDAMRRAKRALRKAAGKGVPLGDGLLRLLGDDE